MSLDYCPYMLFETTRQVVKNIFHFVKNRKTKRYEPQKRSTLFPIAQYSPTVKEQCQGTKRVKKVLHIRKCCTFEVNHSQRLNKVFQRAGIAYKLHPFGHIAKRGEKSA